MIFKRQHLDGFQKPLLLFLGGVSCFVLAAFVFATYLIQQSHNDESVARQLESVQQLFNQQLHLESEHITSLLEYTESDPVIQAAFLARSRPELLQAAQPLFDSLNTKHNITHFYFINLDQTCFLRIHRPSSYGDFINRYTMKQAAQTGNVSSGIELGPFGTFSLRIVKPWVIDGKRAGYIELAKEIHHITPQLKKTLSLELFFMVDNHFLTKDAWQKGHETGSWDEIPGYVIVDRTLPELPADILPFLKKPHGENEDPFFKVSMGNSKYRGGFVPLVDAGGNNLGKIIVLSNATKEISALSVAGMMLITGIFIGTIILLLFATYTKRLESGLFQALEDLKTEILARKDTELKLHQHEVNLEKIVLDRTAKLEKSNALLEKEIQEKLYAEALLLERESLLKKTEEIAHIGSWSLDFETDELIWSDEVYRIFGLSPQNFRPTKENFLEAIHPQDREMVVAEFRDAIEHMTPFNLVHRILRPDGTVRIVHEKSEELFDSSGEVIASSGMIHDITEQAQAEKALQESDEQLRLLIQSSEDMISLHDFDGTYTYYNGPSRYSSRPEDIVGKTPYDFFSRETAEKLVKLIQETAATGKSRTYEIQLDWFGEKIWFSEYIYPVFEEDGTITKVAKIRRNINELKIAEEEIQTSQQNLLTRKEAERKIRHAYSELDQIFNAAVPLSVTKDYKLVKVNKAFCSYFGVTEQEITGKYCHDLWDHDFCESSVCPVKNIFDGAETFQRSIDRLVNGRHITCSIRAVPYKDEHGQLLGVVSTFFDMSAHKKAEDNLQKAQNQLLHAEKLSAVGQLSASIAHEFNNPLQGVMAVLSGVKRRVSLDTDNAKLVDLALTECNRMKSLIKDLQDFYRPTTGIIAPMDLHDAIDTILLISKKNLRGKRIRIKKKYTPDLPHIEAVSDQIKQVILNLVNNASYSCGDDGTIEISTKTLEDKIALSIKDSGKGIKPDNLKHIFEPFYTTKPAVKGTGLGLSVSYGIVKKHGGNIQVESEPDKGATFTVTLPIKAVRPEEAEQTSSAQPLPGPRKN